MPQTWGDLLPKGNRYSSQPAPPPAPVPVDDCTIVQQHEKAFREQPAADTLDEWEPVTEQMLLDFLPAKIRDRVTAECMPDEVAEVIDKIKVWDNDGYELGSPAWFPDGTPNRISDVPTGPVHEPWRALESAIDAAGTVDEMNELLAQQYAMGKPFPSGMTKTRKRYLNRLAAKYRQSKKEEVLGDESKMAECESCSTVRLRDDLENGVECKACGGFFCRRICWANHWCEVMTDWNGDIVKLGDSLRYTDGNKKIWTVTEMPASHLRLGIVRATCKREENMPIRPRLMTLQ